MKISVDKTLEDIAVSDVHHKRRIIICLDDKDCHTEAELKRCYPEFYDAYSRACGEGRVRPWEAPEK